MALRLNSSTRRARKGIGILTLRFDLGSDDGYLTLGQLWEGDFTPKGVGTEAAFAMASKIAQAHGGTKDTRHGNWIIPYRRGLSLFSQLDRLRTERSQTNS